MERFLNHKEPIVSIWQGGQDLKGQWMNFTSLLFKPIRFFYYLFSQVAKARGFQSVREVTLPVCHHAVVDMLSTKQNFSIGVLGVQVALRLWMLFTVLIIILGCPCYT